MTTDYSLFSIFIFSFHERHQHPALASEIQIVKLQMLSLSLNGLLSSGAFINVYVFF